jgi:hypothetical protein
MASSTRTGGRTDGGGLGSASVGGSAAASAPPRSARAVGGGLGSASVGGSAVARAVGGGLGSASVGSDGRRRPRLLLGRRVGGGFGSASVGSGGRRLANRTIFKTVTMIWTALAQPRKRPNAELQYDSWRTPSLRLFLGFQRFTQSSGQRRRFGPPRRSPGSAQVPNYNTILGEGLFCNFFQFLAHRRILKTAATIRPAQLAPRRRPDA